MAFLSCGMRAVYGRVEEERLILCERLRGPEWKVKSGGPRRSAVKDTILASVAKGIPYNP
jgi:hypothetical protein